MLYPASEGTFQKEETHSEVGSIFNMIGRLLVPLTAAVQP